MKTHPQEYLWAKGSISGEFVLLIANGGQTKKLASDHSNSDGFWDLSMSGLMSNIPNSHQWQVWWPQLCDPTNGQISWKLLWICNNKQVSELCVLQEWTMIVSWTDRKMEHHGQWKEWKTSWLLIDWLIDCSVMVQFYWCEVWCASDDWGSSLRWGMYSSLFLCTTAAKLGHIISF